MHKPPLELLSTSRFTLCLLPTVSPLFEPLLSAGQGTDALPAADKQQLWKQAHLSYARDGTIKISQSTASASQATSGLEDSIYNNNKIF